MYVCVYVYVRWSEAIMLLGKIGINNLHLLSPVIPPRLKTLVILILITSLITITLIILTIFIAIASTSVLLR